MAMTYEQTADLMRSQVFIGRVKVAGLTYADYMLNEPPGTQGHSARYRWAQQFMRQPDIEATNLTPMVTKDAAVQDAGVDENGKALITDAALQPAVEGVINKFV